MQVSDSIFQSIKNIPRSQDVVTELDPGSRIAVVRRAQRICKTEATQPTPQPIRRPGVTRCMVDAVVVCHAMRCAQSAKTGMYLERSRLSCRTSDDLRKLCFRAFYSDISRIVSGPATWCAAPVVSEIVDREAAIIHSRLRHLEEFFTK